MTVVTGVYTFVSLPAPLIEVHFIIQKVHLSKNDFKITLHFKIIENLNTEYLMLKLLLIL